jgi:azurin
VSRLRCATCSRHENPPPAPSDFCTLVLSGCGQKDSATAGAATAAAPAPVAGPRVIEITANDTMKYTIGDKQSGPDAKLTIEAKAGEQLKIVLTNTGTLPKEAMGHNWVLLKAGTDVATFDGAAAMAKEQDYIPAALKDQIIASIGLLGPRKSGEVVFTVPAPGEYPFLCTFPAHFQVGMKGTLVVK